MQCSIRRREKPSTTIPTLLREVESSPGKGSTFWVDLPLIEATTEATEQRLGTRIRSLADQATSDRPAHPALHRRQSFQPPPDRTHPRAPSSKIALLHVAHDGAEALEFLFATGTHEDRAHRPLPGVILLDLNLPKIDGLEVLRRIKADKRTKRIPVIVLTVSNHDRDIASCRRLGVESYIVKPVGFQNFSEVTPHLRLDWALKKPSSGGAGGTTGHETKTH